MKEMRHKRRITVRLKEARMKAREKRAHVQRIKPVEDVQGRLIRSQHGG